LLGIAWRNGKYFPICNIFQYYYEEKDKGIERNNNHSLNLNEFLYNSFRITTMVNILEKLLNNNINPTNRNCLIIILKKIAKIDRRALNVMEKLNIEP
jgi:hypothetical protein